MTDSIWFDLLLGALLLAGGFLGVAARKNRKFKIVLIVVPLVCVTSSVLYLLFEAITGNLLLLVLAFFTATAFSTFWPSEWFDKEE